MPTTKTEASTTRLRLLNQIKQLAQAAIYGSLSETYRRCGNPDCRCHHGGPKHGPHLYISYRGKTGKTTGYYVPHRAEAQIRQGVQAWAQLQDCLRELAAVNKERLIPAKTEKQPPISQQALASATPFYRRQPHRAGRAAKHRKRSASYRRLLVA